MSLIDKITDFFGNKDNSNKLTKEEILEAGVCPNCWGKQDYDNKFHEVLKDNTKSNINNDKTSKKAFIQQFVETNVTGIVLKENGDHSACPACNGRF